MRRASILFYYSLTINLTKRLRIVPSLGGFQMLMSFYGSTGHIMAGSGFEKVFDTAYCENPVKHILTGKAIARANRVYRLPESDLMIRLQQQTLMKNSDFDLNRIRKLYEK